MRLDWILGVIGIWTLGVVAAALSRVLADECKAWMPCLTKWLIRRAIGRLPQDQRERYKEEWQSHIDEMPGEIGRIVTSVGFVLAANKMSSRLAGNNIFATTAKSAIDSFAALAGLILLALPMIMVAVAIKITSPGPVIFSQVRCGKRGKQFKMFKFRSMYCDAEQRRQKLEAYRQMSGPVFEINNDPRITPLGRWLRKYRIDELPQLINVLIGQMSFVGPTPLPVYEVENFSHPAQRRRLSVKPGITCLWQMSSRNEVRDFETWVKLDLDYIDNWSIWLDLRILFRTVLVVLRILFRTVLVVLRILFRNVKRLTSR
jgi:lipopolysaccharide/colanic/teichoic acid biosynthesis glycosyltransferase